MSTVSYCLNTQKDVKKQLTACLTNSQNPQIFSSVVSSKTIKELFAHNRFQKLPESDKLIDSPANDLNSDFV